MLVFSLSLMSLRHKYKIFFPFLMPVVLVLSNSGFSCRKGSISAYLGEFENFIFLQITNIYRLTVGHNRDRQLEA